MNISHTQFGAHPPNTACRQYQEDGEFGEAILQCVECYQMLDAGGALSGLNVAPELRAMVQRHYYDTLQRLDVALQRCCGAFSAEGYSKVRGGRRGCNGDAAWCVVWRASWEQIGTLRMGQCS